MCMLVEAGIRVLCPVHDAVAIEGPQENTMGILEQAQEIMRAASKLVLGGYECEVDVPVRLSGLIDT
jgi:DNA polymerase-1